MPVLLRRRRVLFGLLLAGLVVVVALTGWRASGTSAATGCFGRACEQEELALATGRSPHTPPTACIHAAECGGGAAASGANALALAAMVPTVAILLVVASRPMRRAGTLLVAGRDLAGRLFRPPRLAL